MIYDNAAQIYAVLLFFTGGAVVYCVYEALFLFRLSGRYKVLPHCIDFVYAVAAAALFLFLTHFLYKGVIKYFTLFCYAAGLLAGRAVLKPPLRKFFAALKKKYKIRYESYTNDKREEDTMANKEQQKKENQKNSAKKPAKSKG